MKNVLAHLHKYRKVNEEKYSRIPLVIVCVCDK